MKVSDKQSFEKKQQNETASSRRKFIKAGAIAGGAAVVGLSLGLPALTKTAAAATSITPSTTLLDTNVSADNGYGPSYGYTPQERWFFMYATDGISLVPTDKFGLAHRPVYMYGFTTPMSWTKPYGWSKGNVGASGVGAPTLADMRNAFADLNWIDPNTQQPIMRGKAMNIGPPIWGVEGDILDITLFNVGFAFGSCVTDPHTIHLHGVHSPSYYDGIPEISFGVPMWNPYNIGSDGCPVLPGQTGPAGETSTFTPATDANLTQGGSNGNVFTYRMYCERPGTYLYHCHVEASEHVHMGMYGPMWIYPRSYGKALTGGAAYNNSLTQFSQEAVLLLNDIDTRWHDSILDLSTLTSEPSPYGFTPPATTDPAILNFTIPDYRPNYWTINGRCLPDTLMAGKWNQGYQPGLLINGAVTTGNILNGTASQLTYYGAGITPTKATGSPSNWLDVPASSVFFPPRQPIQTYVVASVAEKILVRLHNAGFQAQPMHFHGVMPQIVGKDTFAWVPQPNSMFSTTTDDRKRMYTIGVFSGENYDLIAAYPDKAAISPKVYGPVLNNTIAASMPYGTSEAGQPESPPFPLNTNPFASQTGGNSKADYGDIVHIADPAIPMVLGPGALDPATGTPTPGIGVPGSSGPGFGVDYTTGYQKTGYPLLYLWHAHDDYKVTNNGDYPGGAVTVVKILSQGSTSPTKSIPVYWISR
jgi:manganese oxidase